MNVKSEKNVKGEILVKEPSSNPFDRIMNQVHKKPASRPQQGECLFVSALPSEIYFIQKPLTDINYLLLLFFGHEILSSSLGKAESL